MEAVTYPSGSYGVDIFNRCDHYSTQFQQQRDKKYCMFWKRKCGAPKWNCNIRLLKKNHLQDPSSVRKASFATRRPLAMFIKIDCIIISETTRIFLQFVDSCSFNQCAEPIMEGEQKVCCYALVCSVSTTD